MYNILNFTLEELQGWMKENKESKTSFFLDIQGCLEF